MQIQRPLTSYIGKYLNKPVEIVFDIGSRDLDQSIEFTSVYPNAKIFAIEANPEQKQECETKSKNYKNIDFTHTALSSVNGNIDFYAVIKEKLQKLSFESEAPEANIGASSIYGHDQSYIDSVVEEQGLFRCTERKYSIPSTTLDNFCLSKKIDFIDVIWIDTQGSELEIFKSGLNILRKTKIIHTETQYKKMYKNQPLYPEVKEFFENNGFEIVFNRFPNGKWETDLILVNKNI